MAELKTKKNNQDVFGYIDSITPETKKEDCLTLIDIMSEVTGELPKMWGDSIIGFGDYKYTYASGRSGEWMTIGFAPRKSNITIYIMSGFVQFEELMAQLGKYKTGKSCLYIKSLKDIDRALLIQLFKESIEKVKRGEINY